ncbi:twin-arginine translocation signal domain-containing protein [Kitasatospora sp. NPDC048286]|uniref:twin-arginine translocation signal domain-containing protein n=1 Tax=Kitasatospora sp. NPDC048286 TaxID=3364047 RepID=UPI003717F21A
MSETETPRHSRRDLLRVGAAGGATLATGGLLLPGTALAAPPVPVTTCTRGWTS